MAFILAGIGGMIALAGVYELIDNTGKMIDDNITKPIQEKWDKYNKDREEYVIEEVKQEQHAHTKARYEKHDQLRKQYKLKERSQVLLHNDSMETCYLVYVTHHLANTKHDAKEWAKKVMKVDYFSGDYFNRTQTRIETIISDQKLEIIEDEWNRYYLVLVYLNQYYIIDHSVLSVNDIVFSKAKHDDVDIPCRWM